MNPRRLRSSARVASRPRSSRSMAATRARLMVTARPMPPPPPVTTQPRPDRPSQSDESCPVIVDCSDAARDDRQHSAKLGADEPNSGRSYPIATRKDCFVACAALANVGFGTHSGLKSDIAEGLKMPTTAIQQECFHFQMQRY